MSKQLQAFGLKLSTGDDLPVPMMTGQKGLIDVDDERTITVDESVFAAVMSKAIIDTARKIYGIEGIHNVVFQAVTARAAGAAWDMLCELEQEQRLLAADEHEPDEEKTENFKAEIIKKLWKDAEYAVDSHYDRLLYQALGEMKMACFAGMVKWEDVKELNKYIVKDHINNAEWRRECEKQYEASDCDV